jgi:hypothetical protein
MEHNATAKWFDRFGEEVSRAVRVLNATTAEFTYQPKCARCGGGGGADKWKFTGWTCFECGGSGVAAPKTVKVYTAEKLAKLQASQEKRDAKKAAELKAKQDAQKAVLVSWREENAAALATMEAGKADWFVADLLARAEHSPLSSRQIETGVQAAERVIALAAEKAEKSWFGTIGERVEIEWTTDKVITVGNRWDRFGVRFLVLGHDAAGNRTKYVGTGDFPAAGETRRAKVTIKEHAEYNGEKQTVVERPKCEAVPETETVEADPTASPDYVTHEDRFDPAVPAEDYAVRMEAAEVGF